MATVADMQERKLIQSVVRASTPYIAESRTQVVGQFLNGDCEWLLSLDYDIAFNPSIVYKLFDAADPVLRPIVGGLYFISQDGVEKPIFVDLNRKHLVGVEIGSIVELLWTGMGCTLIHRSVFEKMKEKYEGPWHWYAHEPGKYGMAGEDVIFCNRARELGFSIYGHTGVIVEHIKTSRLTLDSYLAQQKAE